MQKFLYSGIFCFGDQCFPAVMAEFVLFVLGSGRRVWEGMCEVTLCKAVLSTVEFRAKWNGLSGCWTELPPLLLSALLGLALGPWSWALSLCWIYSISLGFPSAGSLTRGTVPLGLTATLGAGHSFPFEHISLKWEKLVQHIWQFSLMLQFRSKWNMTTQQLQ